MVSKDTARTIVGIIGNIISFGLFASPIPTFKKIYHEKQWVGSNQTLSCNCVELQPVGAIWPSFVHPDSVLVITINGIGLVMEIIYVSIFFTYSDWAKHRDGSSVHSDLCCCRGRHYYGSFHTHHDRSMFVGILCVVFNVVMYASPLTVMRRVIRTRSVKYMPFLSLANLMNGIVWLIYALIKIDAYMAIPNALGTISGLVQMVLYAAFYKSTPEEEEGEEDTRGSTLSGSNYSPNKFSCFIKDILLLFSVISSFFFYS
ncbi:hypothetical protein AAG906_001299 [Vitis piasezkii]